MIAEEGIVSAVAEGYLAAAELAVELLLRPEVAEAWEQPSALEKMTVGGLAGHVAYQVFSVADEVAAPASDVPPISLAARYAQAGWIDEPVDGQTNTGIRARGEQIAAEGAEALGRRTRAAVAELRAKLPRRGGDEVLFLANLGHALTLDDFLVTRLMEFAVHLDDLAVSTGLPTPELPDAAFDPALVLLARLAARRHGQTALIRALARAERAPSAVNAL